MTVSPPNGPSPSCDCETNDNGGTKEKGRLASAESLRSSYVTNVRGELVSMNSILGANNDATMLVFLRHLG